MVSLKIGNDLLEDIDLVIFDKDGTLIELNHYWVKMTRLRAETIARLFNLNEGNIRSLISAMGVDAASERLKQCGPVGVKKREEVMKAATDYLTSIGYKNPTDLCIDAFDEVDRVSLTIFDRLVHAIPGSERLLKELHENGCKIAIATSDRTSRARLAMEHLNLLQYIDNITGADSIVLPKPDPETVTSILKKLDGDPNHTIVIGDTEVDLELGVKSGVRACIGVFSGIVPRKVLVKKTRYVIDHVGLIEVIK